MCVRGREQKLIESLAAERGDAPCTCTHAADDHDPVTGWCKRIVRWSSDEVNYETCMCEEYVPANAAAVAVRGCRAGAAGEDE